MDKYNPNITSSCEKKYIIQTYSGKKLLEYSKENNKKIKITNNLYQSLRYTPFVELLYLIEGTDTQYNVYNSSLIPNQFNTYDTSQLILDDPNIINEKKILMMDNNLMCYKTQEDLDNIPVFKQFRYITNEKLFSIYYYFSKVNVLSSLAYEENIIYRWNTFLYYPMTLIFLLIQKEPYKIYVMQTFSSNFNNSVFIPDMLIGLAPYLTLPDGWTYTYLQLSNDNMLMIQSLGEAKVISDNLKNSYMYIIPETNKWLYDIYKSK